MVSIRQPNRDTGAAGTRLHVYHPPPVLNPAPPSAPAPATSAVSAAQPAVLRYGGDAGFAPCESLDAQGRPQGFQLTLLQAWASR